MGCGTGDLRRGETFTIKLRFNRRIDVNDAVYTHFEDAVRGLLRERLGGYEAPPSSAGQVQNVQVVVTGPLEADDRRQFNRAMNRLLWGVRSKCPAGDPMGDPRPSGFEVRMVSIRKNDGRPTTTPTWMDEDTCGFTRQKTRPKRRAKSPSKRRR